MNRIIKDIPIYLLFLSILIVAEPLSSLAHGEVTPPNQPLSGPGGKEYPHAYVIKNSYGTLGTTYWLYEPASPTPDSAPVVVFNHGWGAMYPRTYGAWIEHIVRRGTIVIFPKYQASLLVSVARFTPNAIEAVKNALDELQSGTHVVPDLDRFAIVGHSMGGMITANMAALANSEGLPQAKAVMCVQPGNSWGEYPIDLENLSAIPAGTLLLTVVGDKEEIVGDIDAKRIFNETTQIPLLDKDFILMLSDNYGEPDLESDHFSPCAPDDGYDGLEPIYGEVDALDYYGFWKLFDGLCDAAFYGINRDFALGDTHNQRFMGNWSDGTPVIELEVSTVNITVASPSFGEDWAIGSIKTIEWTSLGVNGNVKIELGQPRGCGYSWSDIASSTSNDGNHSWAVQYPPQNNCIIRICSIEAPTVCDESDTFDIVN